MNSHVGVFVIVIWKLANGAQTITDHLDQELGDANKDPILGLTNKWKWIGWLWKHLEGLMNYKRPLR
jgi:hypothetical protein